MSVLNQNKAPSNTQAPFRAWMQFIHDALSGAGWVQTSDTGQVNLTTITAASAVDQQKGYEMWRMADTLQATAPVFMRLTYGSDQTAANNPSVWFEVGTGSDGAGNITGPKIGSRTLAAGDEWRLQVPANTTTVVPCYASGGTNRISVLMWADLASTVVAWSVKTRHLFFSVERTKNDDGTDNATGVVLSTSDASYKYQQTLRFSGTIPPKVASFQIITPSTVASAVDGTTVGVFPSLPFAFRSLNPLTNLLGYFDADIKPDGSTFSVSLYGTSRTYLAIGTTVGGNNAALSNTGPFAMRYE